jgi:hypothetical protein
MMLAKTQGNSEIGILKSIWTRRSDGQWAVHDLKGIKLKPQPGFDTDFFAFKSEMELLTSQPPRNLQDMFSSFGPTDFLMKQSIFPVVVLMKGAASIKCIGTAFAVSCTGYVVTASHVVLDPRESGYGEVKTTGNNVEFIEDWSMGVLIPVNPASGRRGFEFVPFEQAWYWGKWRESPLIHEAERLDSLTDVAVCKIPERPHGAAYQPLNLSINPFGKGEVAYAIGYAMMDDIPIGRVNREPKLELYVSTGEVIEVFPQNHLNKEVPTPGPCFDFRARIPAKMSGAPIFGAGGSVVRGVVSRSFSGEKHAYGCMIGPVMTLPFTDGRSLKALIETGNEGIPVVRGHGL